MELELAIALTCDPTGCQVRLLDGGETSVRYSNAMQDRIKVRPGDLVVVDNAAQPAVVAWRWWHGRVERMEGGMAVISREGREGRAEEPVPVPGWLAGRLAAGDTVFYSHGEGGVLDVVRDGSPSDPERVRTDGFPEILATYARMNDAG